MNQEVKDRVNKIESTFATLDESLRAHFIKNLYDELILLYEELSEDIQLELDKWNELSDRISGTEYSHSAWIPANPNDLEAWATANLANLLSESINEAFSKQQHAPELGPNGPISMSWLEGEPEELHEGYRALAREGKVTINERGEVIAKMKFAVPKEKEDE